MLARLRALARNLAIYGIGDVAASIVSFLLLPLYVHYLTPTDYGAIGLLLSAEVVAKIVFQRGASTARSCASTTTAARATSGSVLASTHLLVPAAANGLAIALLLAATPAITSTLFQATGYERPFRLVLVNTFVIGFYFLPFHVMRMEDRSSEFAVARRPRARSPRSSRASCSIVGLDLGVLGYVRRRSRRHRDVHAGARCRDSPRSSARVLDRDVLLQALRFGLPRLPHGLAQQVMAVPDRYLLGLFAGLRDVGHLLDRRELRARHQALSQRLRIRVGTLLLRDDEGAPTRSTPSGW